MKTLIKGGTIVNEGKTFRGYLVVDGEQITHIYNGEEAPRGSFDKTVDASGCFVMPGVIDDHVHFREPGLTAKADIESESRAAAFGGVTSYFDMPNTVPQTTTLEALADKAALGSQKSHVNYAFFYGATNDNVESFSQLDRHRIPGIKLFMGSSTGNMLVDKAESLRRIFQAAHDLDLPLMAHCEDTDIINSNIAHVTTACELDLFTPGSSVTGEAVIAHLYFTEADYATKKALIKCNPAIKTLSDRTALRKALTDGRIATIGTDHAPHEWKDKQGGCAKAASGMPMVQFSLVTMLELVDEGVLTLERMVELMAHQPARLFEVQKRGFLREGYQADIVIVRPAPWTLTRDQIQSKCRWSPMEGHEFQWRVEQTFCNGRLVYDKGAFDASVKGQPILFRS